MNRAVGAPEHPGPQMMKQQPSPNKTNLSANALNKEILQRDSPTPAEDKIKDSSGPSSPQRKPPAGAEAVKGPESQKQPSPALLKKTSREGQKTGDSSPQFDSTKPTESLSGKMFGFGSSIFSSASTLINSAVQDEPKPAAALPNKMPTDTKVTKTFVEKEEKGKNLEKVQQPNALLQSQASVSPKVDSSADFKSGKSTCPLCKVDLNCGSKDPPNYRTCTECMTTVCNQCGFNPMPNMSEVSTAKSSVDRLMQ